MDTLINVFIVFIILFGIAAVIYIWFFYEDKDDDENGGGGGTLSDTDIGILTSL